MCACVRACVRARARASVCVVYDTMLLNNHKANVNKKQVKAKLQALIYDILGVRCRRAMHGVCVKVTITYLYTRQAVKETGRRKQLANYLPLCIRTITDHCYVRLSSMLSLPRVVLADFCLRQNQVKQSVSSDRDTNVC